MSTRGAIGAAALSVALWVLLIKTRAPASSSGGGSGDGDGDRWLATKYEHLSTLVPLTNSWRFGDATASETMHAALWNGTHWDLTLTNRMSANASLDILLGRDVKSSADGVRVLDAGCGWGGTVFALEARRQQALLSSTSLAPPPLVRYDGLTLAPTQARSANETAVWRGLEDRARFYVGSFEAALPSTAYDVIVAIESLEHAADLGSCLRHLGSALRAGGLLLVVTDLLVDAARCASSPTLLAAYSAHWCGPHTAAWGPPATLGEWQAHLHAAGLRMQTHTDLSRQLYQRPRWALAGYLHALLLVHRGATALGLEAAAFHASTQIGGVARELLLHDGIIAYTFMVARRAGADPADGTASDMGTGLS